MQSKKNISIISAAFLSCVVVGYFGTHALKGEGETSSIVQEREEIVTYDDPIEEDVPVEKGVEGDTVQTNPQSTPTNENNSGGSSIRLGGGGTSGTKIVITDGLGTEHRDDVKLVADDSQEAGTVVNSSEINETPTTTVTPSPQGMTDAEFERLLRNGSNELLKGGINITVENQKSGERKVKTVNDVYNKIEEQQWNGIKKVTVIRDESGKITGARITADYSE
jgi:hypothetical protein